MVKRTGEKRGLRGRNEEARIKGRRRTRRGIGVALEAASAAPHCTRLRSKAQGNPFAVAAAAATNAAGEDNDNAKNLFS